MELVQLFRENCMSKEIAHYIRWEETMAEAWGRLDIFHYDPLLFIRDLMQEIRASPRLKEREYEKLLRYYLLLLDLIREADKAGQRRMFLTEAYIEEMTCALPLSEKTLWRERKARVLPNRYDAAFWTFVNDRLLQTSDEARDVRRTLPLPTSSPIDAARSGSVGGRHSKGKETKKKANTRPVRKNKKIPRSARASDNPARIRGSSRTGECAAEPRGSDNASTSTKSSQKQGRTGNPAQKREPTSKPVQERSHDTLSRKHSQEQDATTRSGGEHEHPKGFDPAGPHADLRTRSLGIPGLRLQQRQRAAGAALTVGTGISCDDSVSSLVQVTVGAQGL
jgi:hypothetical protein